MRAVFFFQCNLLLRTLGSLIRLHCSHLIESRLRSGSHATAYDITEAHGTPSLIFILLLYKFGTPQVPSYSAIDAEKYKSRRCR